jgi:hypothetical protein
VPSLRNIVRRPPHVSTAALPRLEAAFRPLHNEHRNTSLNIDPLMLTTNDLRQQSPMLELTAAEKNTFSCARHGLHLVRDARFARLPDPTTPVRLDWHRA